MDSSRIGRHEMPMAAIGIAMGGHVRVGFEDNVYLSKGVLAKSNGELVEKVVRIAKELGREIATPDEAREILGLKKIIKCISSFFLKEGNKGAYFFINFSL